MALKTTLEQLETVQAAIEKIESQMQSYTLDGRSVSYAPLNHLYAREKILLDRYNRETKLNKPRVSQANMSGVY